MPSSWSTEVDEICTALRERKPRTLPMNAEKSVFKPSASTNAVHIADPAGPDIAWSSVLIERDLDSSLPLGVMLSIRVQNKVTWTDFIMSIIRSGPSASKNCFLTGGSLRAEQRASNMFSMNSVSSACMGSRRRNCWINVNVGRGGS